MNFSLSEWLNLFLRWFHVLAAILWVGQTFLFTWMDRTLNREQSLWMVHSGGFYIVERQKIPKALPQTLHWFRWEAAMTWFSGLALLVVVYYLGGLMDTAALGGVWISLGIGFILLAVSWLVYDLLWTSGLARNEIAGAAVSYLLLVAVLFGLTRVLTGRAAYIHIGAILGTLMTVNVWSRILPFQRQMVAAAKQGAAPDMSLGDRAKQRTKHNTYMVVPVVLIMISNHFPVATYGNQYNWQVLSVLILVGWLGAAVLRAR
jgi:uncharacterized membrane protein